MTRRYPNVVGSGPGADGFCAKLPVIKVVAPGFTVAVWSAGGLYPWTAPKCTVYVPGGRAVHMPQSSRGAPFTEIVDGRAGFVTTRR